MASLRTFNIDRIAESQLQVARFVVSFLLISQVCEKEQEVETSAQNTSLELMILMQLAPTTTTTTSSSSSSSSLVFNLVVYTWTSLSSSSLASLLTS